jgi:imidazolonepropionase-like amidohydrolase
MYVVQVAYHYGVSNELIIASLIAEPAKALGLDNRIGFVRPGYDADLVVQEAPITIWRNTTIGND